MPIAVSPETVFAGQHLVENDAEAVDVTALIDIVPVTLLRTHVIRRAEYLAFVR